MQEFTTDAPVHAYAARHIMHITADLVAEQRHLVDKGNLGRQKSVGRVLDQLGGFERGDDERRLDQKERAIEVAHDGYGLFVAAADDDAVWPHEIIYRRALTQEFRVRDDAEIYLSFLMLAYQPTQALACPDGDCGFRDNHLVAVHVFGHGARHLMNLREIG